MKYSMQAVRTAADGGLYPSVMGSVRRTPIIFLRIRKTNAKYENHYRATRMKMSHSFLLAFAGFLLL